MFERKFEMNAPPSIFSLLAFQPLAGSLKSDLQDRDILET